MAGRRNISNGVKGPARPYQSIVARLPNDAQEQPALKALQGRKARKAGKRSDPAFRPTTVFVRKETQRKATRLLEDQDTGKDFSDLVEELVANWIIAH